MKNSFEFAKEKKITARGIAAVCSVLLLAGNLAACSGSGASDAGGTGKEADTAGTGSTAVMSEDVVPFQVPENSSYVIPEEKSESVTATADAAGNPRKVDVEVDLTGISGSDPILDCSHLTEIQNTEGDEAYAAVGDARYAWENEGADIHYKGVSRSELPVSVRIRYYMDGKELQPEEMSGKSGRVKIRVEYENHTSEKLKLPDGSEKEAPVPFIMFTTVLLDGDKFTDIEVDHGKAVDLGDQTVVIGYGLPGVEKSLALTDYEPTEDVDIPESVEITGYVTDFSLDFTATVATTGLFEKVEDEDLEDLDELPDDMDDLSDASSELADAAGELSGGSSTFGKYLGQYFSGISSIAQGTGALDEGLKALEKNGSQLTAGAESLKQGLSALETALSQIDISSLPSAGNSGGKNADAQAVVTALQSMGTGAQSLGEQLEGIEGTLTGISGFIGQAQSYKESVTAVQKAAAAVEIPSSDEVTEGLAGSLAAQASEQAGESAQEAAQTAAEKAAAAAAEKASEKMNEKTGQSLTQDEIREIAEKAAQGAADGAGSSVSISLDAEEAEKQKVVDRITQAYATVMEAIDGIAEFTVPDMDTLDSAQLQEIGSTISGMQGDLQTVSSCAQNLSSLMEQLSSLADALSQLQTGVAQLREGSDGLTQGITAFTDGISQLAGGSSQLDRAMQQVSDAGGELSGGYRELESGLEAFADGVCEFDEEGIGALEDLAGDDFRNIVSGIRALREAELSYDNYSGILDGQKGSVRFIIETDEIEE